MEAAMKAIVEVEEKSDSDHDGETVAVPLQQEEEDSEKEARQVQSTSFLLYQLAWVAIKNECLVTVITSTHSTAPLSTQH
jgi:hypothetical protein